MSPDWATFQLRLLDRFSSKLRAKQALANIMNLTQCSKLVRNYAVEFELNTGRFDSLNEATLMQFFIWALQIDVAKWVSIMPPTFLS